MADQVAHVIYLIDANDRVSFANNEWDRFALSNEAPEIVGENIRDRILWDFISGITLQHLYRHIFRRVRAGENMEFNFRCDAPHMRRFLNLRITPAAMGGVRFETTETRVELRDTQELLRKHRTHSEELITACSWCNKIEANGIWQEVEEAVRSLGLFEVDSAPMLSHGICPACHYMVSVKLK